MLTWAAAWLPAYLPGSRREDVLLLLPSGLLGVLLIAILASAASAGGRELLPREQAVAFPLSPAADHLGAVLMAPLNIAWLVQAWTLLGSAAYVVGPHGLLLAQLPVLAWLFAATTIAQLVAWAVEWVRRGGGGTVAVRVGGVLLLGAVVGLVSADRLLPLLDRSPTVRIVVAVLDGAAGGYRQVALVTAVLLAVGLLALALGAPVAGAVALRPARDVLLLDGATHPPRPDRRSAYRSLVRVDRAGVWRSVPLRRGMAVLAVMPGAVAVIGALEWPMLTILPGLVASGGALLFGVNTWSLDGAGSLWRESLPVGPVPVFLSRVQVLAEVLLVSTLVTLALASVRAGVPSASEAAAVLAAAVVVTAQVVAAALRWSVRSPYAVDMRSARATPAPPVTMVGYSSRLAVSTTLTGLVFSVAARVDWWWSPLLAVPFLLLSARKMLATLHAWEDPTVRSRVVTTVAG
jgi:hypothetical protein